MDAVINRIIEIEKQCAMEIEQAEDVSREKIEAHRRALLEKREREQARITSADGTRATQAIAALKKRTEEESLISGKNYESRFRDPVLAETVKEKIVAILLTE